jgi:NAD(P)-dependent dehydrogenase (short-subunit alcohol dehydrogenase family)
MAVVPERLTNFVIGTTIVSMTTTTSSNGMDHSSQRRVLLVGASRGLGLALAREWAERGWLVLATVRGPSRTPLHELAETMATATDANHTGTIEIETLDITEPSQVAALRGRLAGQRFDVLFVNAGVTNEPEGTVAETSTEEFTRVMVTNALSPLRTIEALEDLVHPAGTIGVMSSGQGSVANNERGGHEVYRGSKAALNTFMRSYAARHAGERRTLVLMAPGWVQTELGGPGARLTVEESIPNVVRTLDGLAGASGLHYVDYLGRTVAW